MKIKAIYVGKGILNTLINNLPIPLNVPGMKYCGPGNKLDNGPPVNKLDSYCKEHDNFYAKYTNVTDRNKADLKLADRAWERFKASDASLGERAAAYAITNVMKAKAKLGMGVNKKYEHFAAVKGDAKRASFQGRIHAKRAKKTKTKGKRKRNS